MAKRKTAAKNEWELEALKKRGQAYEKELRKRLESLQNLVKEKIEEFQNSVSQLLKHVPVLGK